MMKKILIALFLTTQVASAAVIATIGDKKINSEDLKKEYEGVSGDQRKAVNDDPITKQSLIDNAVNAEVMFQAAKKAGLDDDQEYRETVERFQKQYLAQKFIQKAIGSKLDRDHVKKFYDENKSFFDTSEVCAHHIVVQDEKLAEKLAGEAKKKGAKFEELAKKNSLDPTVQENKGNLGCFTRERMVPEFSAAAFNMHKGEIKGPIRTMYGYHVIRVDNMRPGKVPGYEEIEQRVKDTYKLKLVNEILLELRKKADVKVNEEEAKKFKL